MLSFLLIMSLFFSSFRNLVRSGTLRSAMWRSYELSKPKPYMVKCSTRESGSFLFLPFLETVESESDIILIDPTSIAEENNELSFCFAHLEKEMHDDTLLLLEELLLAKFASDTSVRLEIDGASLLRKELELTSNSTCWVGDGAYANIRLGLLKNSASGVASMSFFNGTCSMTGPPDDELLNSVIQGLLAGRLGILTRTEPDPIRPWRRVGEWVQTKGGNSATGTLLVVVSLYTKDFWKVDGTLLNPDAGDRILSCSTTACTSLAAQLAALEQQRKRQAKLDKIEESLAAQTGLLIEKCLMRAPPKSDFSRKSMELIQRAAFLHEQTVGAVIERVIKDLCRQ